MSRTPQQIGIFSFFANITLAAVKIVVGIAGASYALIADGIESVADCLSSLIVWNGLRVANRLPDEDHPYGHGKAESVSALLASVGLVLSAFIIVSNAVRELLANDTRPAFFTVPALIAIILVKEGLYQITSRVAHRHDSNALLAEAWHHRSDSLTSLGVLAGIVIAVFAGPRFSFADELAACLVTVLILYNAWRIARPALDELMDRRIEGDKHRAILKAINEVEGVCEVETLIVRRSGQNYLVDVHLEVDPQISVDAGHGIAHLVKDKLLGLLYPSVIHVTTHIEPHQEVARPDR